jgi:hypothetical protein
MMGSRSNLKFEEPELAAPALRVPNPFDEVNRDDNGRRDKIIFSGTVQ